MVSKIPVLNGSDYISDPKVVLKQQFSYFAFSYRSQSNRYLGNVKSLNYLFAQYSNDPPMLVTATTDSMNELFKRYFKDVTVYVMAQDEFGNEINSHKDTNAYTLSLNVTVKIDGVDISLNQVLNNSGGNVESNVQDILNNIYNIN